MLHSASGADHPDSARVPYAALLSRPAPARPPPSRPPARCLRQPIESRPNGLLRGRRSPLFRCDQPSSPVCINSLCGSTRTVYPPRRNGSAEARFVAVPVAGGSVRSQHSHVTVVMSAFLLLHPPGDGLHLDVLRARPPRSRNPAPSSHAPGVSVPRPAVSTLITRAATARTCPPCRESWRGHIRGSPP